MIYGKETFLRAGLRGRILVMCLNDTYNIANKLKYFSFRIFLVS